MIQEEVKLIQSSVEKNALLPLNEIAQKLAGKDVEILQFHSLANKDFNLLIKSAERWSASVAHGLFLTVELWFNVA